MQGYIIKINRVKDEDLIVTILTKKRRVVSYRFYGARHSTINLGYKIDFELHHSYKTTIAQLRNVLHLAFGWNVKREKMFVWQEFITLFYKHLRDVEEIDEFYFDLLEKSAQMWDKQNPKRVAIEAYVELLEYEGRLHNDFVCFKCDKEITDEITLLRAFLPAHKECSYQNGMKLLHVRELFENRSTIFLDDKDIDKLWEILLEGF